MKFEEMGRYQLRDVSCFVGGISIVILGIILLLTPNGFIEIFNLPDEIELLFNIFMIFWLALGVILIYCAFLGNTKNYFLDKNGKCAILKGVYCSSGDCRNCTFADTYLKLHMVKVGNTVIVKLDEE